MGFLELIVALVIAGFVLWLVNTLIPMDPQFKTVLNAIVAIFLVLWVLQFFGVKLPYLNLKR